MKISEVTPILGFSSQIIKILARDLASHL